MDIENLVHMANRIGEFFQACADRQEALDGVATHIRRYWEPRMRQRLAEHLRQSPEGGGLHALVVEALKSHPEVLA